MRLMILILALFLFFSVPVMSDKQYAQTRTDGLIRVGISTNDFTNLEYKQISLSSEGKLNIYDKSSNSKISETAPGEIFKFSIEENKDFLGPISVEPADNNPIKVVGLKRKGKQAAYRGTFEIIRIPGKKGKFALVNVLPLEDYLKGVVPNELDPMFGMEALKAQAIAARNYAIRPRVRLYSYFDVCDSVASQVYFGYNTEKPESNKAVDMTKGLVILYEGEVIIALYSSTAGGYTENYENAFLEPPQPYLKGKPDNEEIPVLNTEEAARAFYTSTPSSFDVNSSYYRWKREWTTPELENELKLVKIKSVDVISRGVSGKIIALSIKTDTEEKIIKKELIIRRTLKKDGKALPSANMIFNNYTDKDGYLLKLEAFGGGFGHGVGMSQYGAGYMAKNGYTYDQILQHYYDSTAIGTWPVYINTEYTTDPIKQEFSSPNKKAVLVIENFDKVHKLQFMINSFKITLDKRDLKEEKIKIPLDKYLHDTNEIIYYPLEKQDDGCSVKVWVEVFRKKL